MMPVVAKRKLAQFVDVFAIAARSLRQKRRGFSRRRKNTAWPFEPTWGNSAKRGSGRCLRYHPASLDHMDHVNDADLAVLAQSDTVATFVPGANYFLGLSRVSECAAVH